MRIFRWLSIVLLLPVLRLDAQSLVRWPYLQNATHNAITIKWRTSTPTDSRVGFGNLPGAFSHFVDSATVTYNHTVRISGLQPYTKYYYSVGTTTGMILGRDSIHHFVTNPVPGTVQPIKIWVIGDFGKANAQENWVRDSYLRYRANVRPADVWLWLGDNAYDAGTDYQYQSNVFDVYKDIFANQVFWPTPGNHDYTSVDQTHLPQYHTGPYYSIVEVPTHGEAGGLPSGGEMFYSFDYGNVHFISLNSELGPWITSNNTPLTQWLEADLQATQQPWKIVYFHQPPHTKGSHDSDNFREVTMVSMRNNIMPIVERNGVDLVLCGHSHVYERSKFVDGFYGWSFQYNPSYEVDGRSGTDSLGEAYRKAPFQPPHHKGTVYAVVGNSASYISLPALNHPMMYYGWGCDTCVGSLVLDVLGDTLRGKYLSSGGRLLDDFTVIKDMTVAVGDSAAAGIVQHFQVGPNPFAQNLDVEFELLQAAEVGLSLVAMDGKEIYQSSTSKMGVGIHKLSLSGNDLPLTNGNYLLKLQVNDAVQAKQLVRMNR
jgi:acid phosphatase type 7